MTATPREEAMQRRWHVGGYVYRPVVVDHMGDYRLVECGGCTSIVLSEPVSMERHSAWHNRNHSMRDDVDPQNRAQDG